MLRRELPGKVPLEDTDKLAGQGLPPVILLGRTPGYPKFYWIIFDIIPSSSLYFQPHFSQKCFPDSLLLNTKM